MYSLGDDDVLRVGICSFAFDFCGQDFNEVYVSSNGLLTFGGPFAAPGPDLSDFLGEAPTIAPLFTDLDPSLGGEIDIVETDGDSFLIDFGEVPSMGLPGSMNSFSLVLDSSGGALLEFGGVGMMDGLVGFACGDGSTGDVVAVDLTSADFPIGAGTEDAIYEQFNVGNAFDLEDDEIELCLTSGDDLDGDDWTDLCGDCDDADPLVFPGAMEICGDSIDNDCDGAAENADLDGDGEVDIACGGFDCDDVDPNIFTGAPEIQCDGIDDNCNGNGDDDPDLDGDLVGGCTDCDDADPVIFPGNAEVFTLCQDGKDNDCDTIVDCADSGCYNAVGCVAEPGGESFSITAPGAMTGITCFGANDEWTYTVSPGATVSGTLDSAMTLAINTHNFGYTNPSAENVAFYTYGYSVSTPGACVWFDISYAYP